MDNTNSIQSTKNEVIRNQKISNPKINKTKEKNSKKIDKSNLNKIIDSHGIGFPIIKKLVELHKGRLEIESEKGLGTKVQIHLKADHSHKNKKTNPSSKDLINLFKNKSVLLAEDNPVSSKISTFLLRKVGFRVKHVGNGQDILDELDKRHFDMIFMDLNMPILNGFETAKIIRSGAKFKRFKNTNIPIIAITGDRPEQSKLQDFGINAVLDKPFSEKELIDFVLEYIKH